jgi:beta-glucosidase
MRFCFCVTASVVFPLAFVVSFAPGCGHSADPAQPNSSSGNGGTTSPTGAGGNGGTASLGQGGVSVGPGMGGPGGSGGAGGGVGPGGSGNAGGGEVVLPPGGMDGGGSGMGMPTKMSCGDGTLPADKTRPGYTAPRDPAVADILGRMSVDNKIKQMYGIANPAMHDAAAYNDIERSLDVDSGTGKMIRGYKYRDAGRGVNLDAGQNDRPSQGNNFATAFPVESARAASWDVDLEFQLGEAMGEETMVSKNNMLLAPCMNIIRHPYWGRTQETYSEDTFHTGRMASALVAGIQQHVIACPKHFAANNIENGRANQNAQMDEQTLREVYGRHYEMVVRDGGTGCLMASYNSINGAKNTQNKHLLTDILRNDISKGGFGFRGLVLSDWWAMPGDQTVPDVSTAQSVATQAAQAGLDLELPWSLHYSQIGALVSAGTLSTAAVDAAAGRVLEQKFRFGTAYTDSPWGPGTPTSTLTGDSITNNDAHLALAEEAEIRSAVLLTNGTGSAPVLPIKGVTSIAVVGLDTTVTVTTSTSLPKTGATLHMATDVNIGDRGSSRVNADPAKSIGPFAGIKTAAAAHSITNVTSGNSVTAAQNADFIVVVVGLTAGDEGEEYSIASHGDRTTLALPGMQEQFVSSVLALDKPTAIIVQSGSIVNLPWLNHANQKQATIWAGYGGQHAGVAFGKLLMGDRNFSGKMPMAWPQEADLPMFRAAGTTTTMGYLFGYRYYDDLAARGQPAQLVFPFGHGVSYTKFQYSNLLIPCSDVTKGGVVNVTVDIANVGSVEGDEIAMLFVKGPPKAATITGARAVKELKGFYKVNLPPMGTDGSAKRITIPLRIDDLRHWEGDANGSWVIDPGVYTIMVGPSGADADLTLQDTLTIKG